MARQKKKSRFSGKVKKSADKVNAGSGGKFDYLKNDDIEFFKPTPGDDNCQLDFIPYIVTDKNHPEKDEENDIALKGEQWWRRGFKVHHKIGSKPNEKTIVCPTTWGGKCPICEKRQELWEAKAKKEEMEPLYTSFRYLYVVIPLKSEGDEKKKIHVMDISNHAFQKLLTSELDTNEDNEIFPDLEEGLTLKCRFSKEVFDEKSKPWAKIARIDFVKRKKQYDEKLLKKVPNLDELFIKHSYDDIDKMFNEVEDVEETIDDSKKENKKGKKDKKKKLECPVGLKFGEDIDTKKKCKKCPVRKECIKAKG